jgi:hypothetical protein
MPQLSYGDARRGELVTKRLFLRVLGSFAEADFAS